MSKSNLLLIGATALLFSACANNPGNIGAAMYENAVMQKTAMQNGNRSVDPALANLTCKDIDENIKLTYLSMQPEEAGLAKRALSTGQGVAETVALSKVASAVPGANMINNAFKFKSGKDKATAVFTKQMTIQTKLQALQAARMDKNCEGSMLELFEEK